MVGQVIRLIGRCGAGYASGLCGRIDGYIALGFRNHHANH